MEFPSNADLAHDFLMPTVFATLCHPLVSARTLMMLGHEYEPPVPYTTLFGKEKLILPNVFKYLCYMRQDIGLFRIFTIGLPASLIGANIRSLACDAYLKKTVPGYWVKKSIIETERGFDVFLDGTCKLTIGRCLGVFFSYPFQVILIRQIAEIVGKESVYSNLFKAFVEVNVNEGFPGLFSGFIPRIIGEVLTVWLSAIFAYIINRYIFPADTLNELKQHTPMISAMFISTFTHRLTVTSTVMAVSGAGLAVSIPFKNSSSCYSYLSRRNAFIRGASLFFRYTSGPM